MFNRFHNWINDESDLVIDCNGNKNLPYYKWLAIMGVYVALPTAVIAFLGILFLKIVQ